MVAAIFTELGDWSIEEYISAQIRGSGGGHMAKGSKNALLTGVGMVRCFRGVTIQEDKKGARILFNCDASFAGLSDIDDPVSGSVSKIRGLLGYVGTGQVQFNGADITGAVASSTLSFIKKEAGVYAIGGDTGPVQAGHAQPSAPTLYAKDTPSANQSKMSGAVAVTAWRVDDITGQPSLKSLPSNVVVLSDQSAIVQFPEVDSNFQNIWGIGVPQLGLADLGVQYELPISLGGEVLESVLAYTRSTGTASIADGTSVVDDSGGAFTSADIGRRYSFSTFDSWITAINSSTQVQVNDTNDTGSTISGSGTITHAVDGILRSIEISWSNGALFRQPLAPDKAFPPPALTHFGAMNDVLFGEGEDGIIYVSEPNFVGSFPPSNAIFTSEPAIHYLKAGAGLHLRFGRHSFGALAYVGGSPALEYQEIWNNQGIMYPANVAIGSNGRLMLWLGRPAIVDSSSTPDITFANKVMPDFEGWENQTEDTPVVPAYDPVGLYEVWCYRKQVNAQYAPTGKWSAPIDLTGKINGNIVDTITTNIPDTDTQRLYLSVLEEDGIKLYQFDAGTGSVMVVQTADVLSKGYSDTVSEVSAQVRCDNTDESVLIEVIKNYDDNNPIEAYNETPSAAGVSQIVPAWPNIIEAGSHALRITITSQGGDAGVDWMASRGSTSDCVFQ